MIKMDKLEKLRLRKRVQINSEETVEIKTLKIKTLLVMESILIPKKLNANRDRNSLQRIILNSYNSEKDKQRT